MDAIDNLIYTVLNRPLDNGLPIQSDYNNLEWLAHGAFTLVNNPPYYYLNDDKMFFLSFPDINIIQEAANRHYNDINQRMQYHYFFPPDLIDVVISDFQFSSPYHLFLAYLLENTRIVQIVDKLIERYLADEEFGIASGINNWQAFNWFINTEKIFMDGNSRTISNLRSSIRPNPEATRRNAYYRMFGLDLAFNDINSAANPPFYKAKISNLQFIPLFEQYLSEIWQAYMNVRNTGGPNSSDINRITQLSTRIRELLTARRGQNQYYFNQNLSYEEFFSVFMLTWYSFVFTYDSPVIEFMGCRANTFGERLILLGNKVGIGAHSKSQDIFEMACPAMRILSAFENRILENPLWVTAMLNSFNPTVPIPSTPNQIAFMTDHLTVINNWEKVTTHPIKNPEANVRVMSLAQTARRASLVTN